MDWVKASIKSELFTSQFGQLEGLKVRAEWDPQISKAISFIPEAQALEEHAKTNIKTASVAH
jgi:carboxyl-terminal processing protease